MKQPVKFKNRKYTINKQKNFTNSLMMFVKYQSRVELAYLLLFKKYLKKITKLKYNKNNTAKCWSNISMNYIIRKKPKNARMGKGIGSFIRYSAVLKGNSCIFYFINTLKYRVYKLFKYWRYLINFIVYLR